MYQSSNPIFARDDKFRETYGELTSNVATIQGVVNKTAILVVLAIIAGGLAYGLIPASMAAVNISMLASMGICFGVGMVLCRNPRAAMFMAPIYAVAEGIMLGLLTAALDSWLVRIESARAVAAGAATGAAETISLAMPAFLITICVTLAMLGLYSARILRPTRRFQAVVMTLVGGVMLVYMSTWVLAMFGMSIPFLRLSSATEAGAAPYIGLGISLLILGLASFVLIIDFGRAEAIVRQKMPRYMEWYAAFGLMVTLAWIYYEAVKLCFRLYLLFGGRD